VVLDVEASSAPDLRDFRTTEPLGGRWVVNRRSALDHLDRAALSFTLLVLAAATLVAGRGRRIPNADASDMDLDWHAIRRDGWPDN